MGIPKQIWTFWNSDDLPPFIKKCIHTWRLHNPDYKITILTPNNLIWYLDQSTITKMRFWKHNDSHQRFSDLVRLAVLERHGGIWLDASIMCNESLDWIHEENNDCLMYTIPELPSDKPVIESWFIACSRHNRYIRNLKNEFMSVSNIGEYTRGLDWKGIGDPNYLLIYVCARKVLDRYPNDVKLLNASEGPYKYHVNGGLKSFETHDSSLHRIVKFRKDERRDMTQEYENNIFKKNNFC